MSLYDTCLRQVLSIRKHEELFAALVNLQIKNDPLSGRHAEIWTAAASRNPALLDWLVLNTEKTMRELIINIFLKVMAACCIDTLNWFATNIRLEYPNLSGQSISNIVWDIICERYTKPAFLLAKANGAFLDATTNFLRDDNVIVAIWMHSHGFFRLPRPWIGWRATRIRNYFGPWRS